MPVLLTVATSIGPRTALAFPCDRCTGLDQLVRHRTGLLCLPCLHGATVADVDDKRQDAAAAFETRRALIEQARPA